MELWKGKVKGYDKHGKYKGTYEAIIEKKGQVIYTMKLSFFSISSERDITESYKYLREKLTYSSSLYVLKRKFKESILLDTKSKIAWEDVYKK
ncbi:hypothetical protein [Priestia flexa]|uniref:hypothetical protein n=1 Tax=Priestia flexa TaxID=86664 RepID=UPI001B335683|nr:hypothetical protein [Priestia flexa]